MALFVKDSEVDDMVDKLASATGRSKTAVIKDALRQKCRRLEQDEYVERVLTFGRDFRARHPIVGPPADKEWIDSLYE